MLSIAGIRTIGLLAVKPVVRMGVAVVIGGGGGMRRASSASPSPGLIAARAAGLGSMGGSKRGMASVSDEVYEPKQEDKEVEDCPELKQLYKERAENGGSPYRWDKTAYARWHFQKLKRSHKPDAPPMKYYSEDYDPECFPDDSVNEAVFEVEMQQRHNKKYAMSSEMELVKWSETPEVWYNRLSVEEKYDAYQHPDCPRQIGILPLPREPQWVLEWSPHDDAYAKDYDSLRYGSQHRDCFENHWFAVHLGSWDYDGDVEKERAAYARFFPEWVSRTDEYPPAGDQQAQWSARLESEAEKRGDCSYLKQLYEERAKNGGTPYRWDKTAYERWSHRDEGYKKYNPEFDYDTLSEAAFEVAKRQRHNKMWAMTSEVIAANRSYIPEVWYNALSVEEKYDAFNHPDCPLKISRLPAPEWPQWVKDWSPHDEGFAKAYDGLQYGPYHFKCFERQYRTVHPWTPSQGDDIGLYLEEVGPAYARFFPDLVDRMNEYPPA